MKPNLSNILVSLAIICSALPITVGSAENAPQPNTQEETIQDILNEKVNLCFKGSMSACHLVAVHFKHTGQAEQSSFFSHIACKNGYKIACQ